MIQAAMYFALGLLTAGLFVLIIMPAVWRRAVRLTRARVEATLPMTLAEIDADKDQLRANFAVANRKLELEAEALRRKLADDTIERGRTRDDLSTLTRARAVLGETVATLEERIAELSGALATSENKLATAASEIAARDQRLAGQESRVAELEEQLVAAEVLTEEQRLEMVARNTELANMADKHAAATASEAAAVGARERMTAELSMERDRLFAEQKRADGLAAGLAALEAERISRLAELERGGNDRRILEATLASERERGAALAREPEQARGGRPPAPGREDERAENRRLRERLAEIATSVVQIGQAMEGKALKAAEPDPRPANERVPAGDDAPETAVADVPLAVQSTETRH